MPKAFLMKKKFSPMTMMSSSSLRASPTNTNTITSHTNIFSPSSSSLFSSSGIGSPTNSILSETSSTSSSLSPRNDENENINNSIPMPLLSSKSYHSTSHGLFDQNQGLDLSLKNLLKESNKSPLMVSNHQQQQKQPLKIESNLKSNGFVSNYPCYPAKFAKIADFLNKKTKKSEQKPINYSTANATNSTTTNTVKASFENENERISSTPYSINWSEHFSINKIIAVSPSGSTNSHSSNHSSSDSGRESVQSSSIESMDELIDEQRSNSNKTSSKRKQSENNRFNCLDCKKSYSTKAGLLKHQEFLCSSQIKKSFSCKHCEKIYISLGALKMHIRTHTLPCKCKICGKAFSRPWLLQGHIRTHTGEKPFACQYCNRAFADRSNLRAHLQTHSTIKKYNCKNCSRTFSRMSLLLKHEDNGCCNQQQQNRNNHQSPSPNDLSLQPHLLQQQQPKMTLVH